MSAFKVIEIINANTIRVEPKWSFVNSIGQDFSDNKVKILGVADDPDNRYIKHTLSSLLMNREVELVNPVIIGNPQERHPEIACNVIVDKTDVTYYFPEIVKKQYA